MNLRILQESSKTGEHINLKGMVVGALNFEVILITREEFRIWINFRLVGESERFVEERIAFGAQ